MIHVRRLAESLSFLVLATSKVAPEDRGEKHLQEQSLVKESERLGFRV